MKRIEVSILAILALLSLLLGIALVQEKQATRNLKINLELTKQELQDTQYLYLQSFTHALFIQKSPKNNL